MGKFESTLELYGKMMGLLLKNIECDLEGEYIADESCFTYVGDRLNKLHLDIERTIREVIKHHSK